MPNFIGRAAELKKINEIIELRSSSLIIINGRRRIGKSRLVAEFAKPYTFYKFSGLAPHPKISAQDQRNEFMRQFAQYFDLPIAGIDDWGTLFELLAKQVKSERTVILFDEISWMAHDDPNFLGKLKNVWDDHLSQHPQLMLFLCGSVSIWIEENLLNSSAFLGRPTLHIRLGELALSECVRFWGDQGEHISSYEKLKLLSVTGGVPRYLELINPSYTAEENIQKLFFTKESVLFNEFANIFKDVYGKRSDIYKKICERLAQDSATQEEVAQALSKSPSSDISKYLEALVLGGFVTRDYNWNTTAGKVSRLSKYRLSDNYLRFSLKYILPNQPLIEKDRFSQRSLKSLPGWDAIMGLQFENLVLRNHNTILEKLCILPQDIIFDNPYFQRKTQRNPGCQIDYMIQTQHDTVYVCEIKFSREKIGLEIIEEMREKLKRLKLPKHISKRAVLIHANGVNARAEDSMFFTKIISFEELL